MMMLMKSMERFWADSLEKHSYIGVQILFPIMKALEIMAISCILQNISTLSIALDFLWQN